MTETRKEIEEAHDGIRPEIKETKKGENKMGKKSIYEKLQNARAEVVERGMGKGGKNKFSNYEYFQLNDILPIANTVLNNNGLTPVFNLYEDEAILTIYDWDSEKEIAFRTDNADATTLNKDGNPSNLAIQTLGSQHTYLKRYLYMNALEIAETDSIEEKTGNPDFRPLDARVQKTPKNKPKPLVDMATDDQIIEVLDLLGSEKVKDMLVAYKINDVKQMTKEDLGTIITIAQRKKDNETKVTTALDADGNVKTASKSLKIDDIKI